MDDTDSRVYLASGTMTTTVATALGGGPLCAAQADTRKGSDRFEKLANSVCWKASLGLGYLWNHV